MSVDKSTNTLRRIEQRADQNNIPPGHGRAAWILSMWDSEGDGERVKFLPRSTAFHCSECGGRLDPDQHGPVKVMLPTHRAGGPGVLGGPYCCPCGIDKLRGNIEDDPKTYR